MFKKIKLFIIQNYLALILALVVGVISVAPQFLYIIYLGDGYKGGYFFSTANEDVYLTKMQEIIEGHWRVGSPFFFEYKNLKPLVPPIGEYFYAMPSLLLHVPLTKILVFSKFLFPAILFLLVYFFILELSLNKGLVGGKINAAVGGLFVTLGYDLIDYKTAWLQLLGQNTGNFLLWTRPVNPIIGALLIFILLLIIWSIINSRKKYLFIPAGMTLALMVGYFFTWGISLSIIAVLIVLAVFKKDFFMVKQLGLTIFTALIASSFYWYNLIKSLLKSGNESLGEKNGMFYAHEPMINKVLLMISLIFLLLTLYKLWKKENIKSAENNWWWFCLAIILGSWLAYNQQIVTGRTIWPYHFVQYTIPFSIVIGMIILGNFLRIKFFKTWVAVVAIILLAITAYNARSFIDYPKRFESSRREQVYSGAISWLNKNVAKDCVVLVVDDPGDSVGLEITALTHCDVYLSNWVFEGAPAERVYHNYLVLLRLAGVRDDQVKDYLLKNKEDIRGYFFENWKQLFSLTTDDGWLYAKIDQISLDYQKFYKQDFSQELKKYRLDYIMSEGELAGRIKQELKIDKPVFSDNNFYIYKF